VILSLYTPPDLVAGSFNLDRAVTRLYGSYLRFFARHVDLFVVPSAYAALSASPVSNSHPVRVVSSGVDLDRFRFDPRKRELFRAEHSLEAPTVLAVGQVIPRKGVETFLEVARRLPDLQFLWLGPKVSPLLFYSARFERLLRGKPDNVEFAGFVKDVEAAYCGSDLLFHPSHGESLGLVIIEAAAVGLPLVVRRLPVYRGWLKENENCLMGSSPDELAEAIGRLVETRSPLPNGLARAHALDRIGQDLLETYKEVLT
jgi:1,2-diacylglycerol-3-alpha-glucose alpha-1,2-glucosyltransferase